MNFVGNTILTGLLSCSLSPLGIDAAELFKWKDADGVTHYSDEPPAPPVSEFKSLEFRDSSVSGSGVTSDASAAADYFSVINQAKRMEASRLERERLRLEKEKLRQQQRAQQPILIPDYTYEYRSYATAYPYYDRYYSGYPYRHDYRYYASHRKGYHLSRRSIGRSIGRARQRLYGSVGSRRHGQHSRGVRTRSIRLR